MTTVSIIIVLAVLQAPPKEERGKFSVFEGGKKIGAEEWRIEAYAEGGTGVFSRTATTDAALTLDKTGRPSLYAAIAGKRETRIEFKDGKAAVTVKSEGTERKSSVKCAPGAFVLDEDSFVQAAIIARGHDAKQGRFHPIRVFDVRAPREVEGSIDDRGPTEMRSGAKAVAVRHVVVNVARESWSVYLRGDGTPAAVHDTARRRLAVLAEYEGWEIGAGFEESEAAIGGLAGAFTRPRGGARVPAVVLVSDWGPHDRDGDVVVERAKGTPSEGLLAKGEPGFLRTIAHALTRSGIAVLRYGDRAEFGRAKLGDFVADAQSAVAWLKARGDVDGERVGIVGHGEGGVIAVMAANRGGGVRAVALLASPGKPLDAILVEQERRALKEQGIDEKVIERQIEKLKGELEAVREAEGDTVKVEGRETFVGWLKEHFAHDPAKELGGCKAAVWVAQGLNDRQVFGENADLLEAAVKERPGAEVRRFEGLDHFFSRGKGVDEGFLRALAERVRKLLE